MIKHPDFVVLQRRLKMLGLYDLAIDDEWGPGMSEGLNRALEQLELAKISRERGTRPPPAILWPKLSHSYHWLRHVGPVPRHLSIALDLLGTVEIAGSGNSEIIMGWRDECASAGIDLKGYTGDAVAWCGLYIRYVMHKAGRDGVAGPLWALNWGKFGEDGGQPELGDVLTFLRPGGGHVALYIGEDKEGYYHVLGGNQSDKVSIMRIAKDRMKACRQPPYRLKPASVKPYIVAPSGVVSHNEA